MFAYLTRKFFYGLLVLLGVITLVFFLFLGFGDPARLVAGQNASEATLSNIRSELNLDQPKWKQFVLYVNDVSPIAIHDSSVVRKKQLRGFFFGGQTQLAIKVPYLGRSYQSKRDVWTILTEALPGTIILAIAAMLFATIIGILLGTLAAVKQNTWMDTSSVFASVIGISAPSFFMGIVIAYLFGYVLKDITGLNMYGSLYNPEPFSANTRHWANLILPAFTLGIRPLAIITQLTRSSMLDVLNQDYIRTAYAKGLAKTTVVFRHALRNALNPVITAVTGWFAELLAGAFFVEYIFGWRGVGKVTVDALEKLDFPVVMGSVLITSVLFILINIMADMLYAAIDPRIGKNS